MKLSFATLFLLTLGTINALPSELERRDDPVSKPVSLINRPRSDLKCGPPTYTVNEIYQAAQYGVLLRIAKQTRGRNSYPHPFNNDDSKGVHLHFPKECPATLERYEFPLVKGGRYNGGKNNVKQGNERVIFYYKDGDVDGSGDPVAQYCGLLTHVGAAPGGFLMC